MLRGYFQFVMIVLAAQFFGAGSAQAGFVNVDPDFTGVYSDTTSEADQIVVLPEIVFDVRPTVLVPYEVPVPVEIGIIAGQGLLSLDDGGRDALQLCLWGLVTVSHSYHSPWVDIQTPPPRAQG